jgi:hypothetical protein
MMKRILAVLMLAVASLTLTAAAQAADCVPSPAHTETTGWVLESPGPQWYQVDERTVTDEKAYDETIPGTPSQHYSYKGGPIEGTPLPPAEDPDAWQANTHLEPHYQGGATPAQKPDGSPYVDGEGGLHYTSHDNEGLADWFYFNPGTPDEVIHHDAVTHEEYKFALDHEAVKCDDPKTPPPNKPPAKTPPKTAFTGFNGKAAAAAGILASLGAGCLYLARKRTEDIA